MRSFKCAFEGPSIPLDYEDGEYQSHFGMKRIQKKIEETVLQMILYLTKHFLF